jgi:hypothetical protein
MKTKTRTWRIKKMRTMMPKMTMIIMTNSTEVRCLMMMMTTPLAMQSIMFHQQRGLVQAASQRLVPLKDKILIWQNILYQVLDMSTQYNILYHTIQYIVFNKNFNISFKTVCLVITKQFILSNNLRLF